MKKFTCGFVLLLIAAAAVAAQSKSGRLGRLSTTLQETISRDIPGWTHRSIEPMEGSTKIIVEQWEAGNVIIKMSLVDHVDEAKAIAALDDFRSSLKIQEEAAKSRKGLPLHLIKDEVPSLGDGGFIWEFRGSDSTVFRKGSLLVFVNFFGPWDYQDKALSRLFANCAADVLTAQ